MSGQGLVGALGMMAFGVAACDQGPSDEARRAAPAEAVAAIDGPTRTPQEQAPAVPTTYAFEGCSVSCPLTSCVVAEHSIECPANTFYVSAACVCDPTGIATCTTSACAPNIGTIGVDAVFATPSVDAPVVEAPAPAAIDAPELALGALSDAALDASGDAYQRPQTCYCGADPNPRASCTRTGDACTYLVTGPRPGTVIPILDQCRCDG